MSQLNVLLFEVGMVTADPVTGIEVCTTVGIHPLVVRPTSIRYTDNSRSPTGQTGQGSLLTRSGRALRSVQLSGTWGVEARGLGPYVGTGEERFQRWYKEVARLPDALTVDDVEACIDPINGTPFLTLLLQGFDPQRSTFYVNWYDFWHGIAFECNVQSFTFERQHRNGGATGLISYNLALQEVGPLKAATLATSVIDALFAGLSILTAATDAIESYDVATLESATIALPATIGAALQDNVNAIAASAAQVAGMLGASSTTSQSSSGQLAAAQSGSAYLGASQSLASAAAGAAALVAAQSTGAPAPSSTGVIAWGELPGDGEIPELARFEALTALDDLEFAARWELVAGTLFGMSADDYRAYVSSGGAGATSGPELRGTFPYTVRPTDTPEGLEARFGVAWSLILSVNGLTPDEALVPGTVLQIPRQRQRGPQPIRGLPTFGSHLGESAWGVDLDVEMGVDPVTGDFRTVASDDVLTQGVDVLVEQYGADLLHSVGDAPPDVQTRYLAQRLQRVLLSDERIRSIESLDVNLDPTGAAYDITVNAKAINGAALRYTSGAT